MNLERGESDLLPAVTLDFFSFQLEFISESRKACLLELIFGTLLCSSGDGSAVVQVALRPIRSARHSTVGRSPFVKLAPQPTAPAYLPARAAV